MMMNMMMVKVMITDGGNKDKYDRMRMIILSDGDNDDKYDDAIIMTNMIG